MAQHEWIGKLLELQEKDLRIIKLRRQLAETPEEKNKVDDDLKAAEAKLGEAKQRVAETEKAIRNLEAEVDSFQTKLREFQSKSTMIRDNHEYRAALDQIEKCRVKISECEDRELELMERREKDNQALAQERKKFEAQKKRSQQMIEDLEARENNSKKRIEELESTRQELLEFVPMDKRSRYERMISRSKGQPVLVPIQAADMCGNCHMNVSAQDRVNAKNGCLVLCQNCGALLYCE